MVEEPHHIILKTSTQEVNGLLNWHPCKVTLHIEDDHYILGSSPQKAQHVDEVHIVLSVMRRAASMTPE
jgi:hypothetical protein